MSGVAAIHHPLRHVDPSAGEIGVIVHIDHPAHRTAVHAHPKLQARMLLERTTDFNRALRRRFLDLCRRPAPCRRRSGFLIRRPAASAFWY